MNTKDAREKIEAALELLKKDSTNRDKFENIRTLIEGVNPKVDKALATASKALSDYERFKKGDIKLFIENVPVGSREDKKKKKRLLFLIRSWEQLRGEVERLSESLEQGKEQTKAEQAQSLAKILTTTKGKFGLITIAAAGVIGLVALFNLSPEKVNELAEEPSSVQAETISVIGVDDKHIPLTELKEVVGPECDRESHYHSKESEGATALDGALVPEPAPFDCGYGKVSEVEVIEVEVE